MNLVAINNTKIEKTYFRGNARFGRTTTLVNKITGEKLGEFMGVCTRQDCYRTYANQVSKGLPT